MPSVIGNNMVSRPWTAPGVEITNFCAKLKKSFIYGTSDDK